MDTLALSRFIGASVRAQRHERSLTQAQLADNAGISERLVRSLERGTASGITLEKLNAVLAALDLELTVASRVSPVASTAHNEYTALLHQKLAALGYPADEEVRP